MSCLMPLFCVLLCFRLVLFAFDQFSLCVLFVRFSLVLSCFCLRPLSMKTFVSEGACLERDMEYLSYQLSQQGDEPPACLPASRWRSAVLLSLRRDGDLPVSLIPESPRSARLMSQPRGGDQSAAPLLSSFVFVLTCSPPLPSRALDRLGADTACCDAPPPLPPRLC